MTKLIVKYGCILLTGCDPPLGATVADIVLACMLASGAAFTYALKYVNNGSTYTISGRSVSEIIKAPDPTVAPPVFTVSPLVCV